ncbi:MAG: cytochrome c oxidase subunit 2 [Acidimicrobiales bacterium]|nr:MAG: cytochrome c oxidase subunit 2 [Acidimicrobiales bacterium]
MSHLFNVRGRQAGLVVALGLLLAGCASDAELDTLEPRSGVADDIYALVLPVFIVAGVVLVLVCGGVLWLGLKNRVKTYEGDDEFPAQVSHNNTLEIAWTAIPAVVMVIIAVATSVVHFAINDIDEANAMTLEVQGESIEWEPTIVVVGQQWWWEYRYYLDGEQITHEVLADPRNPPPADIVTSGQFAIPTGQEVELIITSRDVIHSHWIPALNGKKDAVPGRFAPWKIEADEPGLYFGQCTEFCGLSHSRMRMQTLALTPADFQIWIDEQMAPATFDDELQPYVDAVRAGETAAVGDDASAALRGLDVFNTQCASCHLVNGFNDLDYDGAEVVSGSAPDLTHLMSRTTFAGGILDLYNEDGSVNVDDLARWIRDPAEVKDNYADELPDGELPRGMPDRNLTERQIDDVIAFLTTLGPDASAEMIQATEVE